MTDTSYEMVLVRIDNRLIHGQILESWVPFTKAKCILIANDNAAGDFFRETIIRMAVPSGIELIISTIEDFAKTYAFNTKGGRKTIVLFGKIADAVKAYNLGFHFTKLNIGNIANEEYKLSYPPSIFLSEEDISDINNLLKNENLTIEIKNIPRERAVNIKDIIGD